jgi:hypothetical protein
MLLDQGVHPKSVASRITDTESEERHLRHKKLKSLYDALICTAHRSVQYDPWSVSEDAWGNRIKPAAGTICHAQLSSVVDEAATADQAEPGWLEGGGDVLRRR